MIVKQHETQKQHLQQLNIALKEDCWNIYSKQLNKFKLSLNKQRPQNITNLNVKDIWIHQKVTSQITILLAQIKFKNLVSLNFDKNQLTSLQFLQRIDMPSLRKLRISQNCIVEYKSLRKLHLPFLKDLILNKNMISGDVPFHEMHLKELNNLVLQFYREKKVQGQDIDWIYKLDCQHIQFLRILSQNRLASLSKVIQLEKKYMKLKL